MARYITQIDTLPNTNNGKKFISQHVFAELTSLCPTTGLPDFYTVRLRYEADKLLPELKSLKMYFLTFRNVRILHEDITNQILDDIVEAIKPLWAEILVRVNNRGGIFTTVARKWSQSSGNMLMDPAALDESQ